MKMRELEVIVGRSMDEALGLGRILAEEPVSVCGCVDNKCAFHW